ncbi:MAG: hypothetical protein AAGD25_34420 [Cyanobacteria bacterium P01_F01_bin.150]
MDVEINRKIKRLWRHRLLITISGVAVLGSSILSLQGVIKNWSSQPGWTLDLSGAVATVISERSSEHEKKKALRKTQEIADKYELPLTSDLELELAQMQAQDLDLHPAQELSWALEQALKQTQDRVQALSKFRPLNLDLAFAHDRTLIKALGEVEALRQQLDQVSSNVSSIHDPDGQALSREVVQLLAQTKTKLEGPLLVLIVSAELEEEYRFELYQGDTLETLIDKEHARARAFLTSTILLTTSLILLMILIVTLFQLQLSYSLTLGAHLIAFLPEECVAELSVLKQRMEMKKASIWYIRLRLLQEFLFLLWVFHIQVRIENLGLPPSDRSTDD